MGNAEAGWPTMKLIISTICFLAYFLISTGQAPFIKPLVQESGNIIDRNTTELKRVAGFSGEEDLRDHLLVQRKA